MQYAIRPIKKEEYGSLKDFLYDAIFIPEGQTPLPRTVLQEKALQNYYLDFGREDDTCLVAEAEGSLVGAVWARILSGEVKGYGYVDASTPEIAISVQREYRKKGIGTALLSAMLALLGKKGYKHASLSVQKQNPALHLYERVGFSILADKNDEYLMVYDLAWES